MTGLVDFLTDLRHNNDRSWFQANKNRYDFLREQFIDDVERLITLLAAQDTELRHCECKIVFIAYIAILDFRPTRLPIKHIFRPIWLVVERKVREQVTTCI